MRNSTSREVVILLHGLGRSSFSMLKLKRALRFDYHVINQNYPSQKYRIAVLAEKFIAPLVAKHAEASKIHFVTHSLGGILVRQYCQQYQPANLGNTVMLGPPNHGSELVNFFQSLKIYRKLNGPAGLELSTDQASVPNVLGEVNFHAGVIAGNRSVNPLYSLMIDGPDDGKVSVESSKVDGMTDHIVLPVTHTFMMRDKTVIKQVKHFLKHSKFLHN